MHLALVIEVFPNTNHLGDVASYLRTETAYMVTELSLCLVFKSSRNYICI